MAQHQGSSSQRMSHRCKRCMGGNTTPSWIIRMQAHYSNEILVWLSTMHTGLKSVWQYSKKTKRETLCAFFSKLISLALKRGRWLIWTRTSIISDTTHSLSSFALVFLKLHWSLREETLLEKWISFAYLFPCKNKVQQNLILKEKSFAYKNLH